MKLPIQSSSRAKRPVPVRGGAAPSFALILTVLLAAGGTAWSRQQKSVFHGLTTEPDMGLRPGAAVEAITLSPIWTYDGFESPLAGDPAPFAATIVAADRAGRVAALDPSGARAAWRVDLEGPLAVGPAVVDGIIYQSTAAGLLIALDAQNGRVIWRAPMGGAPLAPPVPVMTRLLVVTDAPELVTLRPEDGQILGRLPLPGRPVAPAIAEDVAIVGTDHGMVLAIDVPTLVVRWRRYMRHAVTAPPLVHDERVYVAVGDRSLHCLRLKSGRPRWRQRTGSITVARLLAREDLLYAMCYDNDIYILRPRSGHLAGRVRMDHRLILDGAVTDSHLFVAPFTEGTVIGLAFPFLGTAGRFRLESAGEWFTTRPVVLAGDRLAVGHGRDAGRVLFLSVAPGAPPSTPAPSAGPAGSR